MLVFEGFVVGIVLRGLFLPLQGAGFMRLFAKSVGSGRRHGDDFFCTSGKKCVYLQFRMVVPPLVMAFIINPKEETNNKTINRL